MSKCAVCLNNVVVNIIMASPDDIPPIENSKLIFIDESIDCDIGWLLTENGFVNPNPTEWSDV